ncbi:hypothetical protein OG2516_14006 [Oceanicola granulosus HTCC2516]|uniref:Membrane-spanning protein n=1 Tax=Oceanicola granulosus (strain ATCC BAA-861 / DSM 15982 / KCTC 12143 / HTCC2516) TaxID=314256 RepID=Q2C9N8_OCEGH|nr:hypothetical protein [Oceanicola granulosus]EAR49386.1 hypothetical protein OG2516_14006 [Oceanicola granulosus HTCC2516]
MSYRFIRDIKAQPLPVLLIWVSLIGAVTYAAVSGRLSLGLVALLTFALTLAPTFLVKRVGIQLPAGFTVGIVVFIYATIFLGEAVNFYERYWWWDMLLHGGSAMGFGMIGFLFAFTLFEGDRYAAPAWALGFIGFTFAVTIGAVWEIFEFAMDRNFGLNMQKSGLQDTMWDLIIDVIGGAIGGLMGFLYLKGQPVGGFTKVLAEFVVKNRHFYRKHPFRSRRRKG